MSSNLVTEVCRVDEMVEGQSISPADQIRLSRQVYVSVCQQQVKPRSSVLIKNTRHDNNPQQPADCIKPVFVRWAQHLTVHHLQRQASAQNKMSDTSG